MTLCAKTVAILFTDVVSSMELLQRAGARRGALQGLWPHDADMVAGRPS
ncbi:MAG: hypothetical protein WBD55_09155 [Dehalococcoidia bacterium]